MVEFKDKTFLHWAAERERIRLAREVLNLPREKWTDDPVMAANRFCNVSREDDKGTRVIKKLIRDPMVEWKADPEELFKAVCIARFFNLPATLEDFVQQGAITETHCHLEKVHSIAAKRMENKLPTFSTAYVVGCPPGQLVDPFKGAGKVSYVCSIVHRAKMPVWTATREGFVKELRKETGFKDFMAGQVAADLAHTPILGGATDHYTWAPFGPGAVRGMNVSLGRVPDYTMREPEYLETGMAQLAALKELDVLLDKDLHLHDVASNVNCESFKYVRIMHGGYGRKFGGPTSD